MQLLEAICSYTRLMGVFSILINWIEDDRLISHIFLLDAEGLGVVEFFELRDATLTEVRDKYIKVSGGLGGKISSIDGRIAVDVARRYIVKNLQYNKPYPDTLSEDIVRFYYDLETNVSKELSFRGVIENIENDVEFVNYIVMRIIAKDREAIEYFSGGRPEILDVSLTTINGALMANDIVKVIGNSYFCTAYFEEKERFFKADIVVTIDRLSEEDRNRILDFEDRFSLRSVMVGSKNEIEGVEIHEIIAKPERLFVYDVVKKVGEDGLGLVDKIKSEFPEIQEINLDGRIFFTEFVDNNDHVLSNRYRINDDILFNLYPIGDKLYLASCDEDSDYSKFVVDNILGEYLEEDDEFDFAHSLVFEFASSGHEDIYDFLNE